MRSAAWLRLVLRSKAWLGSMEESEETKRVREVEIQASFESS